MLAGVNFNNCFKKMLKKLKNMRVVMAEAVPPGGELKKAQVALLGIKPSYLLHPSLFNYRFRVLRDKSD